MFELILHIRLLRNNLRTQVRARIREVMNGGATAVPKKKSTSSLPPYKKEYDPLVEALKKVKKTSQINGLSMGPPMGARPANVDKDVAAEFTSVFCKAVIDELKGGDKKKKVGMKAVRSVRAHITHSIITKQPTNTGTCTNT